MADLKTLRVCLSSELPLEEDRTPNYIYFTYDKLVLYQGVNELVDNYAIVENIPDEPIHGIMYLLLSDGSIHKVIDYSDTKIAEIEDENQLSLLRRAGAIYFVNNDRRYIDKENRTMVLPYYDGSYNLAISMRNDIQINNDTLIKYNEDKERFQIFGGYYPPWVDFSKKLKGGETNTVNVSVENGKILADAKISAIKDNLLKKTIDGLFVRVDGKLDLETYNKWYQELESFKAYATEAIDSIQDDILDLSEFVSRETISQDIRELTEARFSTIQQALDNYSSLVQQVNDLNESLMQYISSTINDSVDEIEDRLDNMAGWEDLN